MREAFPSLRSAEQANSQVWGQKSQHRLYSMVAPLAHQQRVVTWRLVRIRKEDALGKGQRHLITINPMNDTIFNNPECDGVTLFNHVIYGRDHNCFFDCGFTGFWVEASLQLVFTTVPGADSTSDHLAIILILVASKIFQGYQIHRHGVLQ